MSEANLNKVTKHVSRINPQLSVNEFGDVIWTPCLVDYDANLFYRGKTVTNDEFNKLFLQQVYQGNYTTDSLIELLKDHLGTAIHRKFINTYKLVNSYVKTFTSDAWGEVHDDGYYYITIPASEHGFEPLGGPSLERMNIDVELYLLNTDGRFYEIDQMYVEPDNTVSIYTDDPDVIGFVVIRTNERSYSLAAGDIHAEQVRGLAKVGLTGLYTDLNPASLPDLSGIETNATNIEKIVTGETTVPNATDASNVTTSIRGQAITDIFEPGSSVVKKASLAVRAIDTDYATIYHKYSYSGTLERDDIVTFSVSIDHITFQVTAVADSNGISLSQWTVVNHNGLALVRYEISMSIGYSGINMSAEYYSGSNSGSRVENQSVMIANWISFSGNRKK